MSIALINALTMLGLLALAFAAGRGRARRLVSGGTVGLHSLHNYYGYYLTWLIGLPVLMVFAIWMIAEPPMLRAIVMGGLPDKFRSMSDLQLSVIWRDIQALASGGVASQDSPALRAAAHEYAALKQVSSYALFALTLGLMGVLFLAGHRRIGVDFRARNVSEGFLKGVMFACAVVAILTTLGIVLSLLFEALRFFEEVPILDFLTGTQWSPQTAIRPGQAGQSGAFGALPVFTGTILVSAVAILVAGPIGLLIAVYLSEYAHGRTRAVVKPIIEVLAGIPTVVYGFFALLTFGPALREGVQALGIWVLGVDAPADLIGTFWDVPTQSAVVAGTVMGIMIIPFISSLSDDVINAVPQSLRDGSFALGATHSETMTKVVFPAALPGIVGAFLLAISRAVGETMIVVMAAGRLANLTGNPFETVTTVTVQIVSNLTGDFEFDGPKTLSAFALGLTLFVMTLALNALALRIVQKYREKYD